MTENVEILQHTTEGQTLVKESIDTMIFSADVISGTKEEILSCKC